MSNRTTDGSDGDGVKRIDVPPDDAVAEFVGDHPLTPILGRVDGERRFVILSYDVFLRLWSQRCRVTVPPASDN